MTRSIRRLICVTALLAAMPGAVAWTQTQGDPEEFTAFAVNMGALTGTGATAQLIININRWSPAAERDELFTILKEKGSEAMLNRLQRARSVGTLRTPNRIGYDLRLAFEDPGKDGGRPSATSTCAAAVCWS